jgi:ABC-type amino acid transport substrate-binding protein
MKKIKFLLVLLLLFSASCTKKKKNFYTIGIDQNYPNLTINGQRGNLNGYIQDLFIEISQESNENITLVQDSYDNLNANLKKNKYVSILSTMPKVNFNLAKYDFSKEILNVGEALIVRKDSNYKSLNDLEKKHIGYISDNSLYDVLQKREIFEVKYINIPTALEDVENNKIEAVVLPILLASKYIEDNQYNLKILYPLLTEDSFRILTLKNKNEKFLKFIDFYLEKLEKNQKLKNLKEKWHLN